MEKNVDKAWADCGWICFLFTTFLRSLVFYYGLLVNLGRRLTRYVEALNGRVWCVGCLLGQKVVNRRSASRNDHQIRIDPPDLSGLAMVRAVPPTGPSGLGGSRRTAEYARATAAVKREGLPSQFLFDLPLAAATTAIRLPARKFAAALAHWRQPVVPGQTGPGSQNLSARCVFRRGRPNVRARPRDRRFPSVASLCLTGRGQVSH